MDNRKKLREWFDWFMENQENLNERHNGKFVVIKDCEVTDVFDNEEQAYFYAKKKYGLGNFLVQQCSREEESYSMQISTPYIYTACL